MALAVAAAAAEAPSGLPLPEAIPPDLAILRAMPLEETHPDPEETAAFGVTNKTDLNTEVKKKKSFSESKIKSFHLKFFTFSAPQKPKDDWSNAPVGGASNWGGPGRDNDMNHMRNDRGGWGGQPPQRQQPGAGGSWGAAPPSARGGAAGWDHESGAMNRRPDDGGTSYWGGRDKAPPGPPGSGGKFFFDFKSR